MNEGLSVLLIADSVVERIGTTGEHIAALVRLPHHRVTQVDNTVARFVSFDAFDVIVLHYSLTIANPIHMPAGLRRKIADFRGLKVLFIQDEYRWIDATAQAIHELGIGVVFSLFAPQIVRQVYHHEFLADVRFEFTLTGYVSPRLVRRQVPDYADRRIDVGYRARKLPAWYGSLALQKWQIAEAFAADARRFGLTVDLSTREDERLYGERWNRFLENCKACLGTESGASVLDYTDQIRRSVEAYLIEHPRAEFAEMRDRIFADVDGRLVANVISPRCFEAAALRTLMVMYPGDYGGILEAGRHYVRLEPDHSNIADVVDIIRSPQRAQPIIDRAYREIACCDDFAFGALSRHLDRVVSEHGYRVRTAGRPSLLLRQRLTAPAIRHGKRLQIGVVGWASRLERMLLAAAEARLPDRSFARLERCMRRLRSTARRVIFGIH